MSDLSSIARFLQQMNSKGVRLWASRGQLHYEAIPGVLTREELQKIRESKLSILSLLENAEVSEPMPGSRVSGELVPLTHSQIAWWRTFRLDRIRSLRSVVSAIRLMGQLDLGVLEQSLLELVRRHEVLRTRIVVRAGVPMQQISESMQIELRVSDLEASCEGDRDAELARQIDGFLSEPIDVASDSLFAAAVIELREADHVLVVALEHIISDQISLEILVAELISIYDDLSNSRPISLPAVSLQFSDYAIWQRRDQQAQLERRSDYWSHRFINSKRLSFPIDEAARSAALSGWTSIRVHLDSELIRGLLDRCRANHATLVMGVFAAYAALVLRWCASADAVFLFNRNGRDVPATQKMVGYFSSKLYLRVQLLADDRFDVLLQRVVGEFHTAYEHADSSCLETRVPPPEYLRNSLFNWTPRGYSRTDPAEGVRMGQRLTCSAFEIPDRRLRTLEWDSEPTIRLSETDGEVAGEIYFSRSRFTADSMRTLAHRFLTFVRYLVATPQIRLADIPLL